MPKREIDIVCPFPQVSPSFAREPDPEPEPEQEITNGGEGEGGGERAFGIEKNPNQLRIGGGFGGLCQVGWKSEIRYMVPPPPQRRYVGFRR